MKVIVDSWAWLDPAEWSPETIDSLRKKLTIHPKNVGGFSDEPPPPIHLYTVSGAKDGHALGLARGFFLAESKSAHEVIYRVSDGLPWPGDLQFDGKLEADQERVVGEVVRHCLSKEATGGILQAAPGFGKTVCALNIINRIRRPAIVLVHKGFLLRQWEDRIQKFLPDAKIGVVQQDRCDFEGKHIVLAMVESLVARRYDEALYKSFGVVLTDEIHRISAPTWSAIPPMFNARYRLGTTATPRRKDGAQNVFFYHIGPVIAKGKVERMAPLIKRVWSGFSIPQYVTMNPTLIKKPLLLRFLCASKSRNEKIVEQLIQAAKAGRKIMVISERLDSHLRRLESLLRQRWAEADGPLPTISFYIGGMKDAGYREAEKAQIIFATSQLVQEGLDIPTLDTLILATPMSDVEQAVGRVQRSFPGKKSPVVVDFRDDNVPIAKRLGELRWKFYQTKGWVGDGGAS